MPSIVLNSVFSVLFSVLFAMDDSSSSSLESNEFEPNLTDSSDYWSDVLMDSCNVGDCVTDTTDWSTTQLDDNLLLESHLDSIQMEGGAANQSQELSSSLPIYTNDDS